jgi:hypothetical protein
MTMVRVVAAKREPARSVRGKTLRNLLDRYERRWHSLLGDRDGYQENTDGEDVEDAHRRHCSLLLLDCGIESAKREQVAKHVIEVAVAQSIGSEDGHRRFLAVSTDFTLSFS